MSFAWRQLQSAMRVLTGTGERRDRLHAALSKLIKLKQRDLPAEVADDFNTLVGGISRFPLRSISQEIKTTVGILTDEEVIDAISRVMRMYDAVAAYQPRPVKHPGGPRRLDMQPLPWPVPALHILETRQGAFFHETA
ncbi:hypothetical protein [Noviherbaspirillum sp. ST9]|uniref:hypothetical protein n=1 Tax=Noviherbaspirillum sp. ST9 TaxID=3401606 RepID=UPI003B58AD90